MIIVVNDIQGFLKDNVQRPFMYLNSTPGIKLACKYLLVCLVFYVH